MKYLIEVKYKGSWIITNLGPFNSREEAERFAIWNYHGNQVYRII